MEVWTPQECWPGDWEDTTTSLTPKRKAADKNRAGKWITKFHQCWVSRFGWAFPLLRRLRQRPNNPPPPHLAWVTSPHPTKHRLGFPSDSRRLEHTPKQMGMDQFLHRSPGCSLWFRLGGRTDVCEYLPNWTFRSSHCHSPRPDWIELKAN